MNTITALIRGQESQGKPRKVFDWDEAARRIREQNASCASAGLCGDWENTGGPIWQDGAPVPSDQTYTYLASTWATPELEIDGVVEDCFIMEDDMPEDWCDDPALLYWPESAKNILKEQKR